MDCPLPRNRRPERPRVSDGRDAHATERQRYYEALKSNSPANLVQMLRDSVDNAVSSIEKLLDEHETNKRGFVS